MSKTINLSHVWIEKAFVNEDGSLTFQLEAERGHSSPQVRPRIKVMIHGLCGFGSAVYEVIAAHRRKVNRVTGNMDWEIADIKGSVARGERNDEH